MQGSTSLTRRMLTALVLPMASLALVLGIGGALVISDIVEAVNDRLLGASARAIAETLSLENNEVTLDLPVSALGMLENDARDNVYYSVRAGNELITGYPDLPKLDHPPQRDGETVFGYATYHGFPIRIAAMGRRVPRVSQLVIVEVAETLEARHALRDRMLTALALLEVMLLALLTGLLPLAVRWGLVPLSRIRRHLHSRRHVDFAPLPLAYVPGELHSLVGAFNDLLARLDSAVQGIRRFTADASHQMRTPLSILRMHVDILRSTEMPVGPGRTSVADIEAATGRLERLLTQLLALARAEGAREGALAASSVDLVALARRVAEEHALAAIRQNIEIRFEAEEPAIELATIEGLAGELLCNLIDNAIRYNRLHGEVVVTVRADAEGAMVIVEDDGPGIPPEKRDAVFTRFHRLDRDQSRPGSGLGLAIVRVLADGIGATVTLADRHDRPGLAVVVRFPRASAVSGTVAAAA